MRYFAQVCILVSTIFIHHPSNAQDLERLTSLAPNVFMAQINKVSVQINDGVTDGCMKWPTGVLKTAEDELLNAELFDDQASRVLQIVANGYAESGTNLCFVNIDLIVDEISNVYFENNLQTYSAYTRFDIWRTSFMISGPRDDMQSEIQTKVGRAVAEFVSDIERSKNIVKENDLEYYNNQVSPNQN